MPTNTETYELVTYNCANCKENKWKLYLRRDPIERRTYLIITCYNKDCVEKRRRELNAAEDDTVIWEEFEVTNQGYDCSNLEEVASLNSHWKN